MLTMGYISLLCGEHVKGSIIVSIIRFLNWVAGTSVHFYSQFLRKYHLLSNKEVLKISY